MRKAKVAWRLHRFLIAVFVAAIFATGFLTSRYVSSVHGAWVNLERKSFPINREHVVSSIAAVHSNAPELRRRIRERLILPNVVVRRTAEGYLATVYGIKVRGILTRGGSRCLVVYLHGHHGDPFNFDYHGALIDQSRARRCDVLTMSMVGIGLNAGPASFPSGVLRQTVHLSPAEAAAHRPFRYFSDPAYSRIGPEGLLISGHFTIVQEAIKNYSDVSMIGISGGGWATTLLAAIIPQIRRSVAWAGSLPDEYRLPAINAGDLEDNGSFYGDFNYWMLYELGTLDTSGQRSRPAFLVYNDQDDCCFANPAAAAFADVMTDLGAANVLIHRSSEHSIDAQVAAKLLFGSQ